MIRSKFGQKLSNMDEDRSLDAGCQRTRAYQLEMFRASINGNVIVVMDTGSGKTHVYAYHGHNILVFNGELHVSFTIPKHLTQYSRSILRMVYELETCPTTKLIWFLAPTVPLCEQQYRTICTHIPQVQCRLLVGSDNVERWTSQAIWNSVLLNIKIVVSPHKILVDALGFGFVDMERLALLVFDEAHYCHGDHPANEIMRDYYRPHFQRHGKAAVPHILGMTASPTTRSKVTDIKKIERNLNAICVTPHIHRSELKEYVHRPEFILLKYPSTPNTRLSILAPRLSSIYENLKIQGPNNKGQQSQLRTLKLFIGKVEHVLHEFGPWAADYYIATSIRMFRDAVVLNCSSPTLQWTDNGDTLILQWLKPLLDMSSESRAGVTASKEEMLVSPKVRALINFLINPDNAHLHGIIFVTQRAAVACLHALLSQHPSTCHFLRTSTFVGSSTPSNRESGSYTLGNWLNTKSQINTLAEFKKQERNIIIATSVLEEGIDIDACNLVVCFDDPPNLKSFIQRRGRARKDKSLFVLFKEDGKEMQKGAAKWEELEEEMLATYRREENERRAILALEEVEESTSEMFEIKSTRAVLTHHNVLPRLYHFCHTLLASSSHVSAESLFTYSQSPISGLITATVTLPNCVDPSIRTATGVRAWMTEKMAKRDAAFQAYLQLYKAGLLNENLLPLVRDFEDDEKASGLSTDTRRDIQAPVETREAMEMVQVLADPWVRVAAGWKSVIGEGKIVPLRTTRISISRPGLSNLEFSIALPTSLPAVSDFSLYWKKTDTFTVKVGAESADIWVDEAGLGTLRTITDLFLGPQYPQNLISDKKDFLFLIIPSCCTSMAGLSQWLEVSAGSVPLHEWLSRPEDERLFGVVDAPKLHGSLYVFQKVLNDGENVSIESVSSRKNFLNSYSDKACATSHPLKIPPTFKEKTWSIPLQSCRIRKMTIEDLIIGRLFPSILHVITRNLLASDLHTQLLSSVFPVIQTVPIRKSTTVSSMEYLILATNTPSASALGNYQKLEFIGDSILKYLVSAHLYSKHPTWPEGFLSKARDKNVANSRLARAAREKGLDAYIWNESFAGKLGRIYISERQLGAIDDDDNDDTNEGLEDSNIFAKTGIGIKGSHVDEHISRRQKVKHGSRQRGIATKVMADVVEALIGAAFLCGGVECAVNCIHFFIPELQPLYLPATLFNTQFSLINSISALQINNEAETYHGQTDIQSSILTTKGSVGIANSRNTSVLLKPPAGLERLIGYTFISDSTLLFQALTHTSCHFDTATSSYQRLEFLGDSVLDMIFLNELLKHISFKERTFPEKRMTLIKHALVNNGFLGWCALHSSTSQASSDVEIMIENGNEKHFKSWTRPESAKEKFRFKETLSERVFHLADFIRHAIPDVLSSCRARYKSLSSPIVSALDTGTVYPWSLFSHLSPDKILSDVVESIIGAVFIDSGGSIEKCTLVAESLGIMRLARRLIEAEIQGNGVDLTHPKNKLGELVGKMCDNGRVEYVLRNSDVNGTRNITCAVVVGGKEVASIEDGVSADDAKTRSAEMAVEALRNHIN